MTLKINIFSDYSHNAKLKIDSNDDLPLEKNINMRNVLIFINPNLDRLFRGSFCWGMGGITPTLCLKLVRIILEN